MTLSKDEREAAIEKMADALETASLGYDMKLTRLVDGVSTYTLTYSDGLRLEFEDTDDAYAHIAARKRQTQATAALDAVLPLIERAVLERAAEMVKAAPLPSSPYLVDDFGLIDDWRTDLVVSLTALADEVWG